MEPKTLGGGLEDIDFLGAATLIFLVAGLVLRDLLALLEDEAEGANFCLSLAKGGGWKSSSESPSSSDSSSMSSADFCHGPLTEPGSLLETTFMREFNLSPTMSIVQAVNLVFEKGLHSI